MSNTLEQLLTMMESLLKSRQLVERCLASLRLFDKIPSVEDWQIIQDLVNFLQVFKKATELLSGSQYPTCSMALLFRSELASALEACTSDSSVIAELKRNMRARFDYRYPVIARSHSALRSAVSRYERIQPLRAAVGRKVERIINTGSVHTARDSSGNMRI
jgi:transposase